MAKRKKKVTNQSKQRSTDSTSKPAGGTTKGTVTSKNNAKTRRQQQQAAQARAAKMQWVRYGGVALLVMAALAIFGAYRNSITPDVTDFTAVDPVNTDGPADAPVKIVEFGDFGCPSCRGWHNAGIKEQLKEEFGDQISFTFRHFPVITAQSPQAAAASQCAAEQDAFWAYHDYIYESTPQNALGTADLKLYAANIGLDTTAFNECLDSNRFQGYVAMDQRAAAAAGAAGTPSFFINGQAASFSFEGMAGAIRQQLEAQGGN